MDPPTLLFGKLKKNKIENPYFLFPPLLKFILIMYRKNKNNKTVLWFLNKPINFSIAARGQHIKTDIYPEEYTVILKFLPEIPVLSLN